MDPALLLNDPDVVAMPLTALSLTGPKITVSASLALDVARKYYPDISSSELDSAIEAAGGDRLEELNLDSWPAVKRWLNSEPKSQTHTYWVPIDAITVHVTASRVNPTDLVPGLVTGTAIGALVTAAGLSVPLAVLAGGLSAGVIAYRRWRGRSIQAAREATHRSRLEHHHLELQQRNGAPPLQQ